MLKNNRVVLYKMSMLVSLFSQTCEDLPDLLKGHDPTIVKNELSAIFALGVDIDIREEMVAKC